MTTAYLLHGDMRESLKSLPSNSISSTICDPPYALASMAKRFGNPNAALAKFGTDGAFARASRGWQGLAWDTDIAFHAENWLQVFRIMKPGAYLVAFSSARTYGRMQVALEDAGFVTHPMIGWVQSQGMPLGAHSLGLPGTEHLRHGATMKPALEPIYVGQKPMQGTARQNYETWGTGCVDVGNLRVGTEVRQAAFTALAPCHGNAFGVVGTQESRRGTQGDAKEYVGRYPSNFWHDGSEAVVGLFPGHAAFHPACPYEAGETQAFYHHPKASKAERVGTSHTTVKPLKLMTDLVRGWTPPGGTVLDPFSGSGSTAVAALAAGYSVVLCESDPTYVNETLARIPSAKLLRLPTEAVI